mgnify:CR=1 FL=1
MAALFAVLGKPDLRETRLAVSGDYWQVVRGQVKVFPGISKTGTASIEPGGLGHEKVPGDRPDLRALAEHLRRPRGPLRAAELPGPGPHETERRRVPPGDGRGRELSGVIARGRSVRRR